MAPPTSFSEPTTLSSTDERTHLLASSSSEAPLRVTHYLTLPRSIVYQATSILSGIDGAIGTYTLYTMNQRVKLVESLGGTLDITGGWLAGFLLTAAGSLAGAACGILFLVIVLKPGHRETRQTVLAKEVICAFFSILFLIAAIVSTVVVATGSAVLYTPDATHKQRQHIINQLKLNGTLQYKHSKPAIAFVCLGWASWLCMTLSFFLVSKAGRYVFKNGPAVGASKSLPERLAIKYGPKRVFGEEA